MKHKKPGSPGKRMKVATVGGTRKENRSRRDKKILLAVLGVGVVMAGGVVAVNSGVLHGTTTSSPLVVKTLPKAVDGLSISIPDAQNGERNLCVTPYNTDASKVKVSECVGKPVLVIPITKAPCPVDPDGAIDAPSDWTLGCEHVFKQGGILFAGHSVHGAPVGAMELIYKLKPGDTVEVGGTKYTVQLVNKFPKDALPVRLTEKNHISMITCYEDATANRGGEVTTDVVVELGNYEGGEN